MRERMGNAVLRPPAVLRAAGTLAAPRAAKEKHRVLSAKDLLAVEQGIELISYDIVNGNDRDVYATFEIPSVTGSYQRRWLTSRAFIESDMSPDTCLDDEPACILGNPRQTPVIDEIGPSYPEPLPEPSSFLALRVVDKQTGIPEICAECDPSEFLIRGRHRYRVQVMMTSLAFLLPADVDPSSIAPIRVGPEPDKVRIPAGIHEGVRTLCLQANSPPTCTEHETYDFYQALTRARVDIERLSILMRTAPTADLPPTVPAPATRSDKRPNPNPQVITNISWEYEFNDRNVPPHEGSL